MAEKSILITGGAGFIGSHLVERLLDENSWKVTIVDDLNDFYSPEIKRQNLNSLTASGEFKFVEGDIRDAEMLKRIFAEGGFQCIVHLAARAGVRPSLTQPRLYAATNIDGTINLL